MRLTKKTKYGYENECNEITECSDKLGQLEDIEDDLGIDLITLFKTLRNGIYRINKYSSIVFLLPYRNVDFNNKSFRVGSYTNLYFKDYGKTWALTKEELENE